MTAQPLRRFVLLVLAVIGASGVSGILPISALAAQATELGRQTLGRPYWHVFLAYAIAVGLIGGWVISIARRLLAIERRLQEDDAE